MKSAPLAVAALFAVAAVVAQPHHRHQHPKRDVVWVTDWVYVTDTVDVTTTVWVSEGFVPPPSSAPVEASTTSSSTVPATATPPAVSAAEFPAQFYQGATPSPSSSSSSVTVAPPSPAPTTASPAETEVAPVATTSPSPPPVPETVAAAAAPAEVPPTTTAAAPPAASAPASSDGGAGGASSGCTAGSPCEGDITYYTAGLGACGWTNDGDTENVVALPYELMGTQSNGNPYCGQYITIQCTATGKTTTAKVVDKCMGCHGDSIDLSNAAFLDLDDLAVGRTTATWWFN
jgi:hypothetical protein